MPLCIVNADAPACWVTFQRGYEIMLLYTTLRQADQGNPAYFISNLNIYSFLKSQGALFLQ